ncbi:MAG TPA: hypothetical protein VJI96_03260 [Candidatus Andersenbacteria bacterium]|nr:hypothetical protein [Candidatus Andersenbacteria bacterium]
MDTQLSLSHANIGNMNFGIDLTSLPSRRESLHALSQRSTEHRSIGKRISPELVEKALANEPFEDFPRIVNAYYSSTVGGNDADAFGNVATFYRTSTSHFLRSSFSALSHIPEISFDISNFDGEKEIQGIERAKDTYRNAGLSAQVGSLQECYDGFQALRNVFGNTDKSGAYSLETVIPSRFLPELLLAAPVWFIDAKIGNRKATHPKNNPRVTHFCDIAGTTEFANVFQMYNRTPRRIDEFSGRDVMPLPFAELIQKTRQTFDFLVIATPYHDLASTEWATGWQRNVDPFLFGFLKHMPEYMFFLGRWSGSGLFPKIEEMIADTMDHIRHNRLLLGNFQSFTPWYMWRTGVNPEHDIPHSPDRFFGGHRPEEHLLIQFADTLLKNYEQGRVFNFLRGEPAKA